MSDATKTIVEWRYTPQAFFEESFIIDYSGAGILVSDGRVKGEFEGSHFDKGKVFLDEVNECLTSVFLAQQVKTHKKFELSVPEMYRAYVDGRRDVVVFTQPLRMTASVGRADFITRSATGEIIQDSRTERLKEQAEFRICVAAHSRNDIVLKRMLKSFSTALNDSDNLFIHLSEVRETLVSNFGADAEVKKVLGISSTEWSRFGRMANDEPFLEGRHRGKHTELTPAPKDQVEWAFKFAQRLIEAYVANRSICDNK